MADSRYYSGSGIYRNVRLVVADKLHIANWGVCVTTPRVETDSAEVQVETTIENSHDKKESFWLDTDVVSPNGTIVASARTRGNIAAASLARNGVSNCALTQKLVLKNPQLWNLNDTRLYRTVSQLVFGGQVIDEVPTEFGIREARFDANKGFLLNGKNLKIKGVCLHHDAGPIGAAVPAGVLERRLRELKDIGVNAIRTSHNPPDPE